MPLKINNKYLKSLYFIFVIFSLRYSLFNIMKLFINRNILSNKCGSLMTKLVLFSLRRGASHCLLITSEFMDGARAIKWASSKFPGSEVEVRMKGNREHPGWHKSTTARFHEKVWSYISMWEHAVYCLIHLLSHISVLFGTNKTKFFTWVWQCLLSTLILFLQCYKHF